MNLEEASVLLVEDEPLLCEAMTGWLNRVAGRGFCAANGKEALRVLKANRIDLVVSDVRMPVMDGIALLETLNRLRPGHPPVILVTGYSDLTLREAYDRGAEAMVEKPIDREGLLLAMRRSLVEPSELWRQPHRARASVKIRARFASLASALAAEKLAFGRKGFCIESNEGLREGAVEFLLHFKHEGRVIAGQGEVRWTAPEEGRAGIEIISVDDRCRDWLVDLLKRAAPVACIPASTAPAAASLHRAA